MKERPGNYLGENVNSNTNGAKGRGNAQKNSRLQYSNLKKNRSEAGIEISSNPRRFRRNKLSASEKESTLGKRRGKMREILKPKSKRGANPKSRKNPSRLNSPVEPKPHILKVTPLELIGTQFDNQILKFIFSYRQGEF